MLRLRFLALFGLVALIACLSIADDDIRDLKLRNWQPTSKLVTKVTRLTIRTLLTKPGWSSREVRAMRGMIRSIAKGSKR